jgi:hypothetical protein
MCSSSTLLLLSLDLLQTSGLMVSEAPMLRSGSKLSCYDEPVDLRTAKASRQIMEIEKD